MLSKNFWNKTEYSGQAVMGFKNEIIIRQLIDDVEFFPIFLQIENFNVIISSIGDLNKNKFYGVSTGFVSSFTAYYHSAQKQTPDEVLKEVGIHKKHTRSYIFGVTDELVQEHIKMLKNILPKCTPTFFSRYREPFEIVVFF
ncbi:22354_t:CDS:2 [Gigaspora margarita]|uniref:22354_t:CDS:1 n=1 Tax=Gigaspora margarita TaxID=4874 RepID=A0ABN7UGI4_GIGMA|nr:22354_t:CDS:2 [Gigaspora margarita]